jgi:hypothetical protein
MDDPHPLKRLITRASDQPGPPFEAPPAAFFTDHRHRRRRATLSVAATVCVVVVVVVSVTFMTHSRVHHQAMATPNALPTMGSVTAGSLAHYRWSLLPTAPIESRTSAVGLWTGTQMVIWGGASGRDGEVLHADGATYDPSTRTWSNLPPGPLSARAQAASVWTGKSVFIWGGNVGPDVTVATDGALYTPADRSWTRVPPAPVTDYGEVRAFWTGTVVVLLSTPAWAGKGADRVNAQSYDPASELWTKLPDLRLPAGHAADGVVDVGAGGRIYLWSMWSLNTPTGPGSFTTSAGIDSYTFEVDSRRWVANALALPDRMASSTPLWNGRDLLLPATFLWLGAGVGGPVPTNVSGVVVDPATSSTRPIVHGPVDDLNAQYLWTGAALLAFNTGTETSDAHGHVYPGEAAAWDPATNAWSRLPNAPLAANEPVAVWTGKALLIWGQLFTPTSGNGVITTGLEFGP